jgi:phage terminase large subunit-like protein
VTRADRVIAWVEDYCVVPAGKDVGKPVKLRPFQKAFLRKLYDNPHGTRRAILSVGRKNTKTATSAMLLLCHLCGPEAVQNSELYSAALSRDQAALLFNLAAKMVRMNADLSDFVTIRDTAKELLCPDLGTRYRALSADAPTAFGLSPAFIVHDELGQVKGPRHQLYEALETATGAHENPLSLVISTQAPTDADLLSVLIDDALEGHDPRTVVELHTAPMDADPFDIATVREANPALGDMLSEREVMDMAEAARRMPSREAEYRNLILNQRVDASSPFVSQIVWKQNGDEGQLSGPVYGGLDLSETTDLTALVLVSPKRGLWPVKPTFWLPEEGLPEKSRQDRVPYDLWAQSGALSTTPGRSIEYEYVAQELVRLFDTHDIRKLAFDRYNMKHLRPWLIKAGMPESLIDERFVDFGQGFVSMGPALRVLESLLVNGKLQHGNHPVLTMCAANAVTKSDPAGNRKLDKAKSSGRIDGMVALAMACAVANEDQAQNKVFPVELESLYA